jgi:galactokinase
METTDETAAALATRFEDRFGSRPRVFRAPGRVNLIGEHTDYNGGFVMPVAIQLSTWVAAAPRSDMTLTIVSEALGTSATVALSEPLVPQGHWSDYVAGVAQVLIAEGVRLTGADLLVSSTLPQGAGLSSSAALEVASALALLGGGGPDPTTLARWCRRAENEFVGAQVGIMDQYVACHGQRGHALLIDCRTIESRPLPLPTDMGIVVCNTMVKHRIAGGEYNARRADCEAAVQTLQRVLPDVQDLRDVQVDDLERHGHTLDDIRRRRVRHVVTENQRVLDAAEALEHGDLARFGELMRESHRSLRDDYDVSSRELDIMVDLGNAQPQALGTRMTGGGFGGCTVSLVPAEATEAFAAQMRFDYARATGVQPDVWVCVASDGAEEVAV